MRQPAGRTPAPGRLRLVQDFINTWDIEAGTDALDSSDALSRWLHRRDLLDRRERVNDRHDLDQALELREALRELCGAEHDQRSPVPAARRVIEAAARRAALTLTHDADGDWQLTPQAGGANGALGRLVAVVYDAVRSDRWWRLKVCQNDACRWAFWDGSPNRTGRWCAMAICGNRAKVTAYRDRTRPKRPQ
jgi:predicted RNA-binding Zn ribbon-like protein